VNISIFVSGELRTFLKSEKMLPYFKQFLEYHGHDVRVFGHTWKHCADERLDHECIDRYIVEDQNDIRIWQLQDIFNRKVIHENIVGVPLDLNSSSFDEFVDYYTSYGGNFFGQYWSKMNCFQQFGEESEPCDVFIRWRWDYEFSENDFESYKSKNFFYEVDRLLKSKGASYLTTNMGELKGIISSSNQSGFSGTVDDSVCFFNNSGFQLLQRTCFKESLDRVLKNFDNDELTPAAHTLWYEYLIRECRELTYYLHLPKLFTVVR